MTARSDAQQAHERRWAAVLELDLDYCDNVYGVAPCTAGRVNSGTLQSGGTSTVRLAAGASAVDDVYNGMTLRSTGGTGSGQERKVIDYVGATRDATVSPAFSPALDGTTTYDMIDRPNGCYNVFLGESPCQDTANFVKGTKTLKFWPRGAALPPGEQVRPYIARSKYTPTEIDQVKALAARSHTEFEMLDDVCRDDLDKYVDQRSVAAGGTYWTRLIARNPNVVSRFARVRRGYIMTPWDWNTFQTELFVVEGLHGPRRDGKVLLKLSDAIKLLDRVMLPSATGGKLQTKLDRVSTSGAAQSGTSNTIVLATEASALDDAYNTYEVYIAGGTGFGQRRVISDYTGLSRTAQVSVNWTEIPDSTSQYEVSPLSLNVGAGNGTAYADPAATGKQEFVRIGDEVVRYTAIAGDVLSWPDATYREQFDTARAEHNANAGVQQCLAYINELCTYVVQNMLNRAGLVDAYIDTVKLTEIETQWYGDKARITVCIAHPEKASELLGDLLIDLNMMTWWDPVQQKTRFEANMPQLGAAVGELTDDNMIQGSVEVERLDEDRLTRSALYYDLLAATADKGKPTSYRTVNIYIDLSAESSNGYNDVRAEARRSRWLTEQNSVLAVGIVARRLLARSVSPIKMHFNLDPRDEPALGGLVDITTRRHVGGDGRALRVRHRIVSVKDEGSHYAAQSRSTRFARRYAFICPNGYPDYPSASVDQRLRAFIANNSGLVSDGTGAYLII